MALPKPEIPQPDAQRWWQKHSAQVEVTWNVTPGNIAPRDWLFSYEGVYARHYRNRRCFWLRGWVRILGLFIGAGIFVQGRPNPVGSQIG